MKNTSFLPIIVLPFLLTEPVAHADDLAPATLHGDVRERRTGEPLEGVLVLVDSELRATTDEQGQFSIEALPAGHRFLLTLIGTSGGQLDETLTLRAGQAEQRRFVFASGPVAAVNVVDKDVRARRETTEVTLSQKEVAAVPGTFGDPLRVIENLPGSSRAPGGFGGALIIRGANPADSGIFLDGVQVPLLYHFGGMTSVVNAEFLNSVTFLPGGFGPEHGRVTAGVVNVESGALGCDHLRASASVDPLDAEIFACAPVGRWRVAAAGRRSYVDTFLPSLLAASAKDGESATIVSPAYFDYQVKAQTVAGRHRLSLFAFGSHDTLKVSRATSAEDADFHLGGAIGFHRLQARHIYFGGETFVLESSLTPGFLGQDVGDSSGDVGTDHHSRVTMYTTEWRETATLRLGRKLTVRGGLDHVLTHWNADFITDLPNLGRRYPSPLPVDEHTALPWQRGDTGLDQAYWAEAKIAITEALTLTPGLRASHLVFDETQRLVFEPRMNVRWQAREGTALTAATGVYRKLPDVFSGVIVDGFGQPNLRAERAVHLTSGIEQRLGALETKLEGFYVHRDDLPSPTSDVEVRDGQAAPVLFRSDGSGRSYGVELLLRLPAVEGRRFSGWVAYTLSRSTRIDRTPDGVGLDRYNPVDPGTPRLMEISPVSHEYLSPFDQTHILTTVGRWELPWKMSLGYRFQLVSGNPTTPLERGQSYYDADQDQYAVRAGSVARNSGRLPTIHRLDVRLDKKWDFRHFSLTAYLEVMNAYNQRPVEAVGYDYRYRNRTELKGLPILPLLGLKGEI